MSIEGSGHNRAESVVEGGKGKVGLSFQRKLVREQCTHKDYRCLGVDLVEDREQEIVFDSGGHRI